MLTVENSIEIGKVYQVIEKWVFFKLFQILQTDSSGGKNHTIVQRNNSFTQFNVTQFFNFFTLY